ncbi:gas vesicle protein GvpJ [Halorarum salinum]|uniref:Gas vesicle protein n=1 Tax=Halorarum salinum TaxID=2743089 RepID=A0A7D5QB18_9EURY|nr:gas vesicle protein [Halobaculum salinum]QLG60701.1 gas vesicle protein [Halobaculum salinum]
MPDARPTRTQSDLADVLELLLDKGVVVNADVVVSIGDTELLSVELRAAIASFDTAAKYGLQFPAGTDTDRLAAAAGVPEIRHTADDQTTLGDLDDLEAAGELEGESESREEEAESAETDDENATADEPEEVAEADDQD